MLDNLEEVVMDSAKAQAIIDASRSSMGMFILKYTLTKCINNLRWAVANPWTNLGNMPKSKIYFAEKNNFFLASFFYNTFLQANGKYVS